MTGLRTGGGPYNPCPHERAPTARARSALDDAHLRGALHREGLQRAVPGQPRQGPDGPLGGLRPADADGLRPRSRARPRRGRQGRRPGRAQGRHARADGRHPAGRDEHVHDDQRHGGVAARALHHHRRGERGRRVGAQRHDAERHHQGVPGARDLRVPARALDAADRRHGRLHRRARSQVEPDQHLQLPPAGGRARRPSRRSPTRCATRWRCSTRCASASTEDLDGQGVRPHLLLRQRRRALRRGAREAARDVRALGGARPRALRRRGLQAPALPLRRAGQLARPDRVPAREQRAAHRARGARRLDGPQRARPRDPAAGVERGARTPPPVGPAVVAAHPAGPRLRDRHPRVPRHLRGLEGDGRARRGAARGRPRRDGRRRRARRRGQGRRLHEGRAGRLAPRAPAAHRGRRADRRRPQQVRGLRALAAAAGRRRRHPDRRSRGRGPAARGRRRSGAPSRDQGAVDAALAELARVAQSDENIMPATIAAAKAGATTGEWSQTLRDAFGEFRAPTGVGEAAAAATTDDELAAVREEVERVSESLGRTLEDPRRQARPRRPLQRRRADRGPRARRRHGRRLRRHPPDAVADRGQRAAGGRPRRRPVDPQRLAPRADPQRGRGAEGARRRRAGRGRRDHPGGRRRAAARPPASPPSTPPRTSTSRRSCATS